MFNSEFKWEKLLRVQYGYFKINSQPMLKGNILKKLNQFRVDDHDDLK